MAADEWRRMCTSFKATLDAFCDALASCARRIASEYIDPASLQAYVACQLIPLNKQPGLRPIGIGEVVRRIIGKAILSITSKAIEQAAGSLQLCAGQECGIEGACIKYTTEMMFMLQIPPMHLTASTDQYA